MSPFAFGVRQRRIRMVVGLGNPGPAYRSTRHNAGALAVQKLARIHGAAWRSYRSSRSLIARLDARGGALWLVFPQTFMNCSGEAVASLVRRLKVAPGDVLVVCDDVALPLGQIRLRSRGSGGGHKGLASIIERLGTADFARLRLGIGGGEPAGDLAAYVLEPFAKDEKEPLEAMLARACEAIDLWGKQGIDECMSRFNAAAKTKEGVR
jgi:PTH1 family peptidyl-tRNA hydrolase